MIDLGEPYMVYQIRIIARGNYHLDKAGNMKVRTEIIDGKWRQKIHGDFFIPIF